MYKEIILGIVFIGSLYLNVSQGKEIAVLEVKLEDKTRDLKKCIKDKGTDKKIKEKQQKKINEIIKEAQDAKCKLKSITNGTVIFRI